MKISVICKTKEWQVERLQEEALNLSVELEVIDLTQAEQIPESLGDVVLWRSSSLGGGEVREKAMKTIISRSILINRCLAKLPRATEKIFQQEYVASQSPSINCIPTFQFHNKQDVKTAIENNLLKLPFIAKPNKGSKGQGVMLVKNIDDLNHTEKPIPEMVFQNFIKNSGDYRVFILGGRVLGVIKRTAKDGGFLNNISKGGSAEMITDPKVLNILRRIGTTVASIFELTLCGVDVVYDEIEKKFFFLEVNTVPQWKGFQGATGINVAKEIILLCKRITDRNKDDLLALVRKEYDEQVHLLDGKEFHFLSRLFLWTKEDKYKKLLFDIKKSYIGETTKEHKAILLRLYSNIPEHGERMAAKEARMEYFKKYPSLEPSLNLLFKYLFAKKIYDLDLKPLIKKMVNDEELLILKKNLENDCDALRILSTHAINYLYLLEFYLTTEKESVNPTYLQEVGSTYPERNFELQLYFFTHCIIGASRFYSEKIKTEDLPIYTSMIQKAECIISNHFKEISLDNKFEFLVCARLCNFHTTIEEDILKEAHLSFSPDANFLIDILNAKAAPAERNDFLGSEHRNVLFIMSQTKQGD